MTTDELAEVVERAQGGDRRAVEAVLAAVSDDVHRLALRMTGCPDDALDATQEILVKVLTRLSTFHGEAAFTTWVHRVAVNHLLDRKRSAVERYEMTFGAFADDLHSGLTPAPDNSPELDLLAREVKHGCTLAMLTCLDRDARVVYVLGEVFGVSSRDGAWICETTRSGLPQTPVAGTDRRARVRHGALRTGVPWPRPLPLPSPRPRRGQPRPGRPRGRRRQDGC